ncbi:MAG TPA: hypothetical protein PKU69_05360, partial [Bacillota bacterium]|nr:hypothetical protein [Bacillota bacterium]
DIYPIDVSLYQHRCFIEVAGNIIGEINYSVAEKKLDFSLRILPEMQQMGFGRTAFEMLYQEIIKHDELASYKVKKTVVFEEGKPFLNRFNFGYNQETDEYEYFIYSEEDIAMINETNETLMKTLTSTITMDEFIAKLDDRLFIDNLDPVFIYLKGLGNIDYNSVDANQIDTYMTSMIEACGTDDSEVTNNMDKIKYFIQLLDSEEIDRLLWIVHQLSYFSVYRLTAQLYYGIELDFDNLQEKESISFHPDFPGAYFNPFDALINGLVILQEHINESENYGYFIPHLEKLKIRASQDDDKGLIDLLDIYQIDTLEEPDIINMIIDPAYENKSGKVIAYLEKTFISYYSDLYINFSIAKALIRSMDKEYA